MQNETDDVEENMLIMGDLNGRVRNQDKKIEECTEKEGEKKTRNNNGNSIIELCIENDRIISNKV